MVVRVFVLPEPTFLQLSIGHLPFLTHALHTVGSYASIVKYVSALNPATLPAAGQEAVPEVFCAALGVIIGW